MLQERMTELKMHEKEPVSGGGKIFEDTKELSFRIRWKRISSEERKKQPQSRRGLECQINVKRPKG